MAKLLVDGITIRFDAEQSAAGELLAQACRQSAPLISGLWGLKVPPRCRVYVMTSWQRFMFQYTAWHLKPFLLLVFPLLYLRMNKAWPKIAGWSLMGQRTIGMKAPALLEQDLEIGKKIYIPEPDRDKKFQGNLCHELVHVCADHLRLPLWLNEGLAMYTVDKFSEKQTVRTETLQLLGGDARAQRSLNYRKLINAGNDEIVYNYVRGYWIARYLEEKRPGFLKSLLQKRRSERALIACISEQVNIRPDQFWNEIDQKVVAEFS